MAESFSRAKMDCPTEWMVPVPTSEFSTVNWMVSSASSRSSVGNPKKQVEMVPDTSVGTVFQHTPFCILIATFVDDFKDAVVSAFQPEKKHEETCLIDIFK